MAATNNPLAEAESRGEFRSHLTHRFGKLVLHVPPLAQRREDVAPLAQHFLESFGGQHDGFSAGALSRLERYDWPGNVRALRSVVESAAALAGGQRIASEDLGGLLAEGGVTRVKEEFELRPTLQVLADMQGA